MAENQSPLPEAAIAALRRGRKIEAIKLTREATGMGLKESKESVEKHLSDDDEVRLAFDTAKPNRSNNLLLVYVILITLALYWFFFRET